MFCVLIRQGDWTYTTGLGYGDAIAAATRSESSGWLSAPEECSSQSYIDYMYLVVAVVASAMGGSSSKALRSGV